MIRVDVKPELWRWAIERSGKKRRELDSQFKNLRKWEAGQIRPTVKQVKDFARAMHVPVGYMFASEAPTDELPIDDFRTLAGKAVKKPSANLLDTIYACKIRQTWYREFALASGEAARPFVGSASLDVNPNLAAELIRDALEFDVSARRECSTWEDALRLFIRRADEAGVLVMVSGIVKSSGQRGLDPKEFRGFALCDPFAPLVFVNGADTKAAQMFTLAHELAHIWLGTSALSNISTASSEGFREEEVWCNAVAAELLVPLKELGPRLKKSEALPDALSRLAREFKVSTLVILRRMLDAESLTREVFDHAWAQENTRLRDLARSSKEAQGAKKGGPDFYKTTVARVGRRFAHALVESTLEGQTLQRDAFRMLGIRSMETFKNVGLEAGVVG